RLRDYRQKSYCIELAIGRGALRDAAHIIHRTGGQRGTKIWLRDCVVEGDHAVVTQRSEPLLAAGGEAQKFHARLPFFPQSLRQIFFRTAHSVCVTLTYSIGADR